MEVAKKEPVTKPQLPPGFRFRPTDEELVVHYLRRRALSSPLPAAVDIPDVRILAHDPSDLLPPGWSEQERYFFTCKEAKYVKGRRANRATGAGYWKATGKEKPVAVAVPAASKGGPAQAQAVLVGMKRSLVFYRGKPPTGSKTDWVMHEYRLAGAGLAPCRRAAGQTQAGGADAEAPAVSSQPAEGWVLCRVFRKKGSASANAAAASPAEQGASDGDGEDAEEEQCGGGGRASSFIDFFARAEERRQHHQQQQQQQQQHYRRASSPVVSSSCLTDASHEPHQQHGTTAAAGREQETTSRGRGCGGALP